MTASKEPRATQPSPEDWQQAMTDFRARAHNLFTAQCERIQCLEASIGEQLEALDHDLDDQVKLSPPSDATETSEQEELRIQLAQCRKLLDDRAEELKHLRSQLAERSGVADEIDIEGLLEQLSELKIERDEVISRLADSERQIERAVTADSEQMDELRMRFEKAVQEIRELKATNEQLERQTQLPNSSPEAAQPTAGGFDWEQQKLRMVQQLEDGNEHSLEKAEDRLTVESTIQITDQVIAEKDREIHELNQMLDQQSTDHGDVSAQTAAIAELLDADEVIQQEREKLTRLQDSWREKLRQAEIDNSVERAKLARERVELEEKMRVFEEESHRGGHQSDGKDAKAQSGRWLSRLGLKDDDK